MTQQILLIEGPDMCGKTHIAQELSRLLGIPSFKASSEHSTFLGGQDKFVNQLRYADTRMVDFLQQTKHSVVFDRAYPSEYAYSAVFNRVTDDNVLRQVDEAFAKLDAKIIVCRRKSYAGLCDDLDASINERVLQRLDNTYAGFCAWTKCKTLTVFVDDEDLKRETSEVMKWLYPDGTPFDQAVRSARNALQIMSTYCIGCTELAHDMVDGRVVRSYSKPCRVDQAGLCYRCRKPRK